ncbi:sodium/bile acid cotransporter 7-like [Trichogramma pretiosum]|uniref:sodium/bile acid cotransporter 7-like n=1 Tax=Trichogramma pretiosum TaxID=7493 RepID=UPI0006C95F92|nr:sodium/bile acid cotransporter 7-like [Trichogramma pretiosum]XP_014238446.1 sodium/bile acid cotransporter 7-like [Trichogramma pretiosum]XP_014238447.1 sodium/bile acid cotransporter 7-like [Trichogramma pretiosum]XP_023315095.1 sodium/bile acid cotransporter 7-like [Trichogramma pretiosum]
MKIDASGCDDRPLVIATTRTKRIKRESIFLQYSFFACMNICMLLAFFTSRLGGSKGFVDGNKAIWYFAIPLLYLEAGLLCEPRALLDCLRDGYLLSFLLGFVYGLAPTLCSLGNRLLDALGVNRRLLDGVEVLHCLPPPFSTSLVLGRIARADVPTSVVALLTCRFAGLLISPILLYVTLGATVPPMNEINFRESVLGTLVPLAIGVSLRSILRHGPADSALYKWAKMQEDGGSSKHRTMWLPKGLELFIAYNLFCDAFSIDAASMHPGDILLCVLVACASQMIVTGLCWTLCNGWLKQSQDVLLASVFACTYKSVGYGGWLVRTAFGHGGAAAPTADRYRVAALDLPLAILTVAQLLLGSLLACWMSS